MMSRWKRTSSGAYKVSGYIDIDRPEEYPEAYLQQFHQPGPPQASSSRQSSLDCQGSRTSGLQASFTNQSGSTPEFVPTHLEAPSSASPGSLTFPSLSPANPRAYKLPPIFPPSPKPAPPGELAYDHGTKDPTIQTLQRENANLASAFSSAQIRIANFDEEVRASKQELAKLVKDRQRLEAEIEVLEMEIVELQNSMKVSQRHAAAKDAQYSQIVELSTKLQVRGTTDAQQCKAEREQWAHERQVTARVIMTLESEVQNLRARSTTRHTSGSNPLPASSRITDQANLIEDGLIGIWKEHTQLMDCIEKLGMVGKNMQTYFQSLHASASMPHKPNG